MCNLECHMSNDCKGPKPHYFANFLCVVSGSIVCCR